MEVQRLAGKDVSDPTNASMFYFGECLWVQKHRSIFCMQSSVQKNDCGGDADAGTCTSSAALTMCTCWQNWGKTSLVQVGFCTG